MSESDSSSDDYGNECALDKLTEDQEVEIAKQNVIDDLIHGDDKSTNSYKLD